MTDPRRKAVLPGSDDDDILVEKLYRVFQSDKLPIKTRGLLSRQDIRRALREGDELADELLRSLEAEEH